MASASRVAVIGRSMHDIAAVWGTLQPFFHSADLIVSEDPAGRALEGPHAVEDAVFAVLDCDEDLARLSDLDVAPDWLLVLCPPALMQRSLAEVKPLPVPVPVLPLEDAALALMGMSPLARRHRQPSR